MVKPPVELLFEASVAVQETVVVVMPYVPEEWLQETLGDGSTSSVAETLKLTVAPEGPVASAVRFPGRDSDGGVVSGGGGCGVTVMVKLAGVALFPSRSVALQVTVVVAMGKSEPEAASHPDVARSPSGSEKPTVNETFAPSELVACVVMSAGTVISGGEPTSAREALSVIADASGVPHNTSTAQTAIRPLTLIPLLPS
jgi:hypothetical protein